MEYPTKHIGIIILPDEDRLPAAFDCVLDLRGEVCPYTFVKTRLTLEEMEEGEILCVIVDYPPAIDNVPRSLEIIGYRHSTVRKAEIRQPDGTHHVHNSWCIIVRNVPMVGGTRNDGIHG